MSKTVSAHSDVLQTNIPVRVAIRSRPLSTKEERDGCKMCIEFFEKESQVVLGSTRQFTYDYVYSPFSQQATVYDESIRPLISNVFKGYNATILAYGQTGSGKTYTMGTVFSYDELEKIEHVGIIPRTIKDLFDEITERSSVTFFVKVSFLEVYKEEIIDLLNTSTCKDEVVIRDDCNGRVKLTGLYEMPVTTSAAALHCLELGAQSRTTAQTAMNAHSSRSHAIFTINIECKSEGNSIVSKIHFVDLAGSERVNKTKAEGDRFKEGVNINLGLLALGNVICALTEGKGRNYVPYRDAKLTRLLQDSLGGNSYTIMIACISPADYNFEETLNTLRYAQRARKIKNKPIVNRDPQKAEVAHLKQLIQQLQEQLIKNTSEPTSAQYAEIREEVKSLVFENEKLKLENEKLACELQNAIDQTTNLYEKAFIAETAREKLREKLEELHQKAGITVESFNQSLDQNDSNTKEQMAMLTLLNEKIVEIQLEQEKTDETMFKCDTIVETQEGDEETKHDLTNEMSTEITFRQAKMNRELQEINKLLAMKEKLAGRLLMNDDKIASMKGTYECLLKNLEDEISSLQKEKEELNQALLMAKSSAACSKLSEQRRKRVQELESQIATLHKKIAEHLKLAKMKEQSDVQVKKLNVEIQELKHARVRLVRQMKSEAERLRVWKLQKEREVCQLKQKDRKRQYELARKEQRFSKQQNVMRIKMEEAIAVNKRLKDALSKQKQNSEQRQQERERTALQKSRLAPNPEISNQRITDWLSQECELAASADEAQHHLEIMLQDRKTLAGQLNMLQHAVDSSSVDTDTGSDGLPNPQDSKIQIRTIKDGLELRNIQISELQQKILDAKQEEKAASRFETFQTMNEAKCALRWLFKNSVASRVENAMKTSTLKELKRNLDDSLKRTDDLQAELTNLRKTNEEELVKVKQDFEEKILCLLNQLSTPTESSNNTSDDIQQLKERLRLHESKIRSLVNTEKELNEKKTECAVLKNKLLEAQYLGPNITKEFKQPKQHATTTKKALAKPHHGERYSVAELFSESSDTEREPDDDPDWRQTPLMKRIHKMKAKQFSHTQTKMDFNETSDDDFDVPPQPKLKRSSELSRCNCTKSRCKAKTCSCKKDGRFCSENCGCTSCQNRSISESLANFTFTVSDL